MFTREWSASHSPQPKLLRYPRDHLSTQDETADGPNAPSTKGSWLNRSIQLVGQIVFAVSFGVALVAMMVSTSG